MQRVRRPALLSLRYAVGAERKTLHKSLQTGAAHVRRQIQKTDQADVTVDTEADENVPEKRERPCDTSLSEAKTCYKSLAQIPIIRSGRILGIGDDPLSSKVERKEVTLAASYQQRDLELNRTRLIEEYYVLSESKQNKKIFVGDARRSPFPLETRGVVLQAYSEDGAWKAVIVDEQLTGQNHFQRNHQDQCLELWHHGSLVKVVNLSKFNQFKHGKIHSQGAFQSLQWSSDNRHLLFVAERLKRREKGSNSQGALENEELLVQEACDEFLLEEDWGENMVGHSQPLIVTYDVINHDFDVIEDFPVDVSPGQAIWGPENSVIFVGWVKTPRRTGLLYSEARESALFQLIRTEKGNIWRELTTGRCCVGYPRLSPDHRKLAYLHSVVENLHGIYERVMIYDFISDRNTLLCDCVEESRQGVYKSHPLYMTGLAQRCWLTAESSTYVAFQTFLGVQKNTVLACCETKKATLLDLPMSDGSQKPLDTLGEYLLLANDSLLSPPELQIVKLCEVAHLRSTSMNIASRRVIEKADGTEPCLTATDTITHLLASRCVMNAVASRDRGPGRLHRELKTEIRKHVIKVPLGNWKLPSLVLLPRNSVTHRKPPLVAFIHGGPHMVLADTFNLFSAAWCSLGFAVVLVNYRGSVGFDYQSMKSIHGKIKYQDVEDCQKIVEHALRSFDLDENNIFAFGGSHGGFIIAHLVAQYPDFYRSVAVRNCPLNLASMVENTDIPDWCYRVSGLPYSASVLPSKEDYIKMLEVSPLLEISRISTPMLFFVGEKDVRINSSQATFFHRALQSLGRPTKLFLYPDGHILGKLDVETSMFMNMFKWFRDNMKR